MIEVIEDEHNFILKSASSSLWCKKIDASLSVHPPGEIIKALNPECLGVVDGVIGKFRSHSEMSWKLLLVGRSEVLGLLPPTMQPCHKVTNLVIITLAYNHVSNQNLSLKLCPKHNTAKVTSGVKKPLRKTWNQFVNAAESIRPKKLNFRLPIGNTQAFTANPPSSSNNTINASPFSSISSKEMKDKDKHEKRILEELQRMFEESPSFYFTPLPGDLTNCTQTLHKKLNQLQKQQLLKSTTLTPTVCIPTTPTIPTATFNITNATFNITNATPYIPSILNTTTATPNVITATPNTTTPSSILAGSTTDFGERTVDYSSSKLSFNSTPTPLTTPTTPTTHTTPTTPTILTKQEHLQATTATTTQEPAGKSTTPETTSTPAATTTIASTTTNFAANDTTTTTESDIGVINVQFTATSCDPLSQTTTLSTTITASPTITTTTKKDILVTDETNIIKQSAMHNTSKTTSATTTTTTPTTTTTATPTIATPTTATPPTATPTTLGWRTADDRFFWNKYMISELIDIAETNALVDEWIIPILHGFVQITECPIRFDDDDGCDSDDLKVKLCIVSRRSRYRAGTRYKRRGVDEHGYTANFVETEQIVEFVGHVVSYIQIRGSVPLYWSQSGIKYKPPPKIERDFDQNHESFRKHLLSMVNLYDKVNIINLVDKTGKERQVGEAYLQHIVTMNHPCLNYVSFDFHDYCKGMRFENISILTESVMEQAQEMKYCWVDPSGMICEQRGVFRLNCIDCLDRTNIVQSALARVVLEMQCRKLGLLSPERQLPATYRTAFQTMWANNGDVISRQYAGTAALKGDFTRTGERKLAGVMRDGVNSANRYYINRVRDVFRQACVDLMQGCNNNNQQQSNEIETGGCESMVVEEDMKVVIEECSLMIVNQPEIYLGGWGMVNADRLVEMTSEDSLNDVNNILEMDSILFLSDTSVYIADWNDDTDTMTCYKKIALTEVSNVEIGVLTLSSKLYQMSLRMHYNHHSPSLTTIKPSPLLTTTTSSSSHQPSHSSPNTAHYNSSLHTEHKSSLFYTWFVPGTRLSHLGGPLGGRSMEDAREMLFTLVGSVVQACKSKGVRLHVDERKISCEDRSSSHEGVVVISQQAHQDVEHNMVEPPGNISGIPTPNLPFPPSQDPAFFQKDESFSQKDESFSQKDESFSQKDELLSQKDELLSKKDESYNQNNLETGLEKACETVYISNNSNYKAVEFVIDNDNQAFASDKADNCHLSASIEQHVQQTRDLQAVLKGLVSSRISSLNEHCVWASCGIIMTRSVNQIALVFEEGLKTGKDDGVLEGKIGGRRVNMLENKSKSLDASAMRAKMKMQVLPFLASLKTPIYEKTPSNHTFKTSHSDYEILAKTSSFDLMRVDNVNNSTFIKLKRKVAQLTPSNLQVSLGVPNLFTASLDNHQTLKNMARDKLAISQMRFQHLNSRIILL